jgi:transcriptional regulator with XRE-family HTH domain
MFKDYQELRDLMGCSQEELAGFFNVPRSSLALSETTERSVKSNSMQIQNRFVLHMTANKKPGDLCKI